jgi:hypothetical protein
MTYEGVQKMPERLDASKVRAGAEILRAIRQAEETLVRDVRADMTPTQMVERKLIALLKRSDAGVFIGCSDLGDMERKQRTSFQILSAVQKGRQRAAARPADRRPGRHDKLGTLPSSGPGVDVRAHTGTKVNSAGSAVDPIVM